MNTTQKLVMMANQIAANLALEPDPPAAVADHILHYWDPRMRSMIRQPGVCGLSPAAAKAIELVANRSDH